jgi:hypothetical protein
MDEQSQKPFNITLLAGGTILNFLAKVKWNASNA